MGSGQGFWGFKVRDSLGKFKIIWGYIWGVPKLESRFGS